MSELPTWDEFVDFRRRIERILAELVEDGEIEIVGQTPDSGPLYAFVEEQREPRDL